MKQRYFKIALIDSARPFTLSGDLLEPMGICCLSSYLKAYGFQTKILHQINKSNDTIVTELQEWSPDLVGISFMSNAVYQAKELAGLVKQKIGCTVVAGGVHASFDATLINEECFDYLVRGEGETPFLKLCRELEQGGQVSHLPDVLSDPEKSWNEVDKEFLVSDLSTLPMADRTGLNMDEYKVFTLFDILPENQRLASIQASRGCRYNCTFCASNQLWRKRLRWRSRNSLVDEIDFLQREYKINTLNFRDESFTSNKNKLDMICDVLLGRNISWYSFARVNELSPAILSKMKDSGCVELMLGIESGTNETLQNIHKGIDLDAIRETCEHIHAAGIRNSIFMMIGFPWETLPSLEATKEFILSLPYDRIRMAFATPFPGTPYYKQMLSERRILTYDFSQYDTEHIVVKTPLSSKELYSFRKNFLKEAYTSEKYIKRCKNKVIMNRNLTEPYERWFTLLKKQFDCSLT